MESHCVTTGSASSRLWVQAQVVKSFAQVVSLDSQEGIWVRLSLGAPVVTPQCGLGQLGTLVTLGTCAVAVNSFSSPGMPLAYE